MPRVAAEPKSKIKLLPTFRQRYRRTLAAFIVLSAMFSVVAIAAWFYTTWLSQQNQQRQSLARETTAWQAAVESELQQFQQDFAAYLSSRQPLPGLSLTSASTSLTSTSLPESLQRWPQARLQRLSLASVNQWLADAAKSPAEPASSATNVNCPCRWLIMPATAERAAQLALVSEVYDGQLRPQYLVFQLPVEALAKRLSKTAMDSRYLLIDGDTDELLAELTSGSAALADLPSHLQSQRLTRLSEDDTRYRWLQQRWLGQRQHFSALPSFPWQGLVIVPETSLQQAFMALRQGQWPTTIPHSLLHASAAIVLLWLLSSILASALLARQQRALSAASQALLGQPDTDINALYSRELQQLAQELTSNQRQQQQQQLALQEQQQLVGLLQRHGLYRPWQYQPQTRRITVMMADAEGISAAKTYAIEQFAVLLDKQQRHAVLTFHCQTETRETLADHIDFQLRATATSPARWLRAYAVCAESENGQTLINGLHIDVTEWYQQQQQQQQLVAQQQQQNAVWQRGLPRFEQLLVSPLLDWLDQLELSDDSLAQRCQRQQWSRQLHNLVTYLAWQMDAIAPEAAVVNLSELLQQLDQQLLPCAEQRRLTLHFEVPEAAYAWADRRYLRLIILNLLDNAIQHSPPGKIIQVKLRDQQQHLLLTVSDVGAGMPAELDTQQAFIQWPELAKRDEPLTGVGLGLTLSRHLATLLNADLRIDEQTQKGCRVLLQLPKMPDRQLN